MNPMHQAPSSMPRYTQWAAGRQWWAAGLAAFPVAAILMLAVISTAAAVWPTETHARAPNFHPCNSQPSLPICKHGYGKRIAIRRWGALPEPLDPDAGAKAALITNNPAAEIKKLKSSTMMVADIDTAEVLFAREEDVVRPIASITKLMAALVVIDSALPMDEKLVVDADDRKTTSELPSRLPAGTTLSRSDLLHLALTASENTAANTLGRTYPGGMDAFVDAMNRKAGALNMLDTKFAEPTGLSSGNVSSARDLVKLVHAASLRPLIRQFSTEVKYQAVDQTFRNTNMLVGRPQWEILVSKTGTTREAGACLVMMIELEGRTLAVVLLNADGMRGSRFGDAVRLRRIVSSDAVVETAAVKP